MLWRPFQRPEGHYMPGNKTAQDAHPDRLILRSRMAH